MTTTLSLLNGQEELSELDKMILAETKHDEQAFDFIATKIRLPSGGVAVFTTSDNDVIRPPLIGIAAISQKARAYWPEAGTGSAPFCSSPDGVHGWIPTEPEVDQMTAAMNKKVKHPFVTNENENSGPFACATCPLAQWGSAPDGGRGQACKTLRRLVMMLDGYRMPVLLTLPPTSVRQWDMYCSGLASRRSSYFAVQTKFELDKTKNAAGVEYATIKVSVSGRIEDKEHLAAVIEIRRQYAELVREMAIDASEYDVDA